MREGEGTTIRGRSYTEGTEEDGGWDGCPEGQGESCVRRVAASPYRGAHGMVRAWCDIALRIGPGLQADSTSV